MKSALKEHGAEAVIGLVVVIVAIWFVIYAWQRTGGGTARGGITVTAQFQNASGIGIGTDVRVAGMKVGAVVAQSLDPKSYMANITLALDPKTRIPADSSAAITSQGILGGSYIALIPGGDTTPLKSGDTIIDTQGSLDLTSLIGQFVNKSGGSSSSSGGSAGAAGAPAKADATTSPTP
ncbi:outer membrane lipid asymmetry maintenance protein MlaD [Sphingomonas morindae]|uniref:Outer membrane lipid asymmetry maintenance protein MlaD n=1 Tax=Sphingomonas morindae TaxID=1541170 RepID=A0ABY4XBU7_9SPHN|nr:outer membrane lipid asymmetry maintenance protein MlaD [Sphingomonas morindae]USI74447.1 outer membrane lipid asymmetry maintenance protein MlaD [Sphingomonas morindae]